MTSISNTTILFCAEALIYIASAYALFSMLRSSRGKESIVRAAIVLGTASLSWLVGHLLKDYIHHARPHGVVTLLTPDDPYSLPSGHATFMFGLAAAAYAYDKRAGSILYVLALLTGIARVLAGVHFWYDILAGACVGYLVACSIRHIVLRYGFFSTR